MSALRRRMIEDMKLAGLAPTTHAIYINAVRGLAAHYRRSPDQLSEEEVRSYLLHTRERGVARGTFKMALLKPPQSTPTSPSRPAPRSRASLTS